MISVHISQIQYYHPALFHAGRNLLADLAEIA